MKKRLSYVKCDVSNLFKNAIFKITPRKYVSDFLRKSEALVSIFLRGAEMVIGNACYGVGRHERNTINNKTCHNTSNTTALQQQCLFLNGPFSRG